MAMTNTRKKLATDSAPHDAAASLDHHLGAAIRAQRARNNLTIAEVADSAGISRGMLSKMENGQVSASLDSLQRIATALGTPISSLFRDFDTKAGGAVLVKKGEGIEVVRRGTRKGHSYRLLGYDQGPRKRFEPFLISLDDESEVFPTFEHPGVEFIHMLEGKLEYRHGTETYVLAPGDSLTFKGDVPHGPERLIKLPIRFLSVFLYDEVEAG
jgi:transcriptional regulator with XRE-family HTH domain